MTTLTPQVAGGATVTWTALTEAANVITLAPGHGRKPELIMLVVDIGNDTSDDEGIGITIDGDPDLALIVNRESIPQVTTTVHVLAAGQRYLFGPFESGRYKTGNTIAFHFDRAPLDASSRAVAVYAGRS